MQVLFVELEFEKLPLGSLDALAFPERRLQLDHRRRRRQIFNLHVNREPLTADLADDALGGGFLWAGRAVSCFQVFSFGHDYTSSSARPGLGRESSPLPADISKS
jgi:hypothetical protein